VSGVVLRLGRLRREPASGMAGLLWAANVTARVAALVVLGFFTFTAPWPGPTDVTVQVAAFAIGTVVVVWYSVAEGRAGNRGWDVFLMPYSLGAVAVTCGAASMTPRGGPLILMAFFVVLWAGADTSHAGGWSVAALGVLGVWSAWLASGANTWETAVYRAAMPLGGLLMGRNVRAHRIQAKQSAALARQSAALLAQAEQLRQEQARAAALDERARIAREIHDVLAHSLGALGLHIQAVQAVLTDTDDVPRAVRLLDQAYRMAADGLSDTRQAVHALRGQTPPLSGRLAQLSASHQQRHGTQVKFEVTGEPRPLPPETALALARTAQEALVNTAKHAPYQPVGICLHYADAHTRLVVTTHFGEDRTDRHGSQFATVNGGYGLTGLRERLLLLDGTLTAGRSGRDWVVAAKVPR
jgi:signal transduction histidine kinase